MSGGSRISVDGGNGMRGEDDLTYKLGDIIRANGNIRRCETEGSPAHVVNEFEQYYIPRCLCCLACLKKSNRKNIDFCERKQWSVLRSLVCPPTTFDASNADILPSTRRR